MTAPAADAEMAPLESVAGDARPLIAAFRAGGCVSFQDLEIEVSRAAYEASCRANGIGVPDDVEVCDLMIGRDGDIGARVYRQAAQDAASALAPGIVFLHGGGWVLGSLDTHDSLCRYLAVATGAIVVAADYRLAPEHRFPAAHDDARGALAWVAEHGPGLGIDPARLVVVGDSAGGNLAAVLARDSAEGRHAPALAGQVLLYPVTDLTMSSASYSRVTAGVPLTASSMAWFAAQYLGDDGAGRSGRNDRGHADLSPSLHPLPGALPPAFVCTVGHDPLADEGIAYAGKLASAGTPVEHVHLPGHAHGLFTSAGRIATGARTLELVADFIRRVVA